MKMIDQIHNEPCMETMKKLCHNFIDGIITSPPYNITTKRKDLYYDNGYSDLDNLSEEQYIKTRLEEFVEFSKIIKDGGVILYNISYHNQNPILPNLLLSEIHNQTSLTLQDIITWKKSNSIPFQTSPTKLSRICELIYVIVEKDYLHSFTTNKKISKINEKTNQKFYKNYNNFIEQKNNDGYICNLKQSFSQDLVNQLINIYFKEDSLIYDPFSGIGTTQLSCIKNNCFYIGSEINEEFYNITVERIKLLMEEKNV